MTLVCETCDTVYTFEFMTILVPVGEAERVETESEKYLAQCRVFNTNNTAYKRKP